MNNGLNNQKVNANPNAHKSKKTSFRKIWDARKEKRK